MAEMERKPNLCVDCPGSLKDRCELWADLTIAERRILMEGQPVPDMLASYLAEECLRQKDLRGREAEPRGLRSRMGRVVTVSYASELDADRGIEATMEMRIPPPQELEAKPEPEKGPYGHIFRVQESGHCISLPIEGLLTLGRLHPLSGQAPDIDLTADDRGGDISRFHARVAAQNGEHYLEDLEGSLGLWINGQRVLPRRPQRLTPGDTFRLGQCGFVYEESPDLWRLPVQSLVYSLYVTFSGRSYPLVISTTPGEDIVIGRADPQQGFVPGIDLTWEGDAALMVSRRHAALRWGGKEWLVKDLGSTNKTKINGVTVAPGHWVSLLPGQHLWLGGFGLALDVKRR